MPLDVITSRLQAFRSQSKSGQQQLEEFCKESPFERTKREVKEQLAKAEQYRAAILKNVTTFAGLNPEAIVAAAQSMEEVFYRKGDVIIRQDDIGDCFYVLEEGLVSVTRKSNSKDPDEIPRELTRLGRNAHFGEIALLTAEPRSATVTVLSEEAKCLRMTKHEFEELLATTNKLQAESRRQIGRDVLDTVPLFKTLTAVNKKKLVESMLPMTYLPGSYICRQGTTGNTFFILTEGSCKVTVNTNDRQEREVATLRAGDFFGEVALIESSNRRTANVISNNTVSCLTLSRTDFHRLLRNLKVKLLEHQALRSTPKQGSGGGASSSAEGGGEGDSRPLSSLSRKRRISGYNTHGQRDEIRIANLLRRFAKFSTEALWNSLYSRYYRDLLLDGTKPAEFGKLAVSVLRSNATRYEAVREIGEQASRILDMDWARRTSTENAFILGLMKQRNQLRDKLCRGWPPHHFQALCRRLRFQRVKPFRKIIEAETRGTTAFLILRGAVRLYGSVKRGEGQAKAYFEEDLFPGEIFGEAALSGLHSRLQTALSITSVDLAVLDDQDFLAAQDRDTQLLGTEERSRFLSQIAFFRAWDAYKLLRLAHALVQEEVARHSAVVTAGQAAGSLVFLVSGRVDVVDRLDKPHVITSLGPGDYLGESGLLNRFVKAVNKKVVEAFSAVAASRLDVLVLPETAFHLFDPQALEQLREAFVAKTAWRQERVRAMKWERAKVRKQYHCMQQEAAMLEELGRERFVLRREEAGGDGGGGGAEKGEDEERGRTTERKAESPGRGRERDRSVSPGHVDLFSHLQSLRPASPPSSPSAVARPSSAGPTTSLQLQPQPAPAPTRSLSTLDLAYRAALVHPLDDRLQNEDVWHAAAAASSSSNAVIRTSGKGLASIGDEDQPLADRLERIPASLSQDLDRLMLSSLYPKGRQWERLQETWGLAASSSSRALSLRPGSAQRTLPRQASFAPPVSAPFLLAPRPLSYDEGEEDGRGEGRPETAAAEPPPMLVQRLAPPEGGGGGAAARPATAPGRGRPVLQPAVGLSSSSSTVSPKARAKGGGGAGVGSAGMARVEVRVELPGLSSPVVAGVSSSSPHPSHHPQVQVQSKPAGLQAHARLGLWSKSMPQLAVTPLLSPPHSSSLEETGGGGGLAPGRPASHRPSAVPNTGTGPPQPAAWSDSWGLTVQMLRPQSATAKTPSRAPTGGSRLPSPSIAAGGVAAGGRKPRAKSAASQRRPQDKPPSFPPPTASSRLQLVNSLSEDGSFSSSR